jgi:hypothetical protein
MGGFANVFGGALVGLGDSLNAQVDAKRKEALVELQHQYATQQENTRFDHEQQSNTQQHGFRLQESEQTNLLAGARDELNDSRADRRNETAQERADRREREQQDRADKRADKEHGYRLSEKQGDNDDVTHFETDDTGEIVGFTKSGKAIRSGIQASGKGKTGKQEADDDKLIARAERAATVKRSTRNPETGEAETSEQVDTDKVADFLRRNGRDDLANTYSPKDATALAASLPQGIPKAPLESRAETQARTGVAPKAAKAPKGSMPIPERLKGEPEGTVVADKQGNQYVVRGGYLIPQ